MAIVQRSLLLAVGLAFILSGCGSTSTNEEILYAIGDTGPAGGIVFEVTDGGLRGMEIAPVDQSIPLTPGVPWGCEGDTMDTETGTGSGNTQKILAGCSEPGIAARVAANYSLNGYTDWFLWPTLTSVDTLLNDPDAEQGINGAEETIVQQRA